MEMVAGVGFESDTGGILNSLSPAVGLTRQKNVYASDNFFILFFNIKFEI